MTSRNLVVAALVYDDLCNFEFSCAAEIFGAPRPELKDRWYSFETVAAEPGVLKGRFGFQIRADAGLERLASAGTVVIPGWKEAAEALEKPVCPEVIEALQAAYARGARLLSVCSGSYALAAAGLLEGRRATTHWRHVDVFRRRFPKVSWDARVLYVEDGQIITSAGSAAGLDACLHIVRRDFGAGIANQLARRLVIQPHRDGGQAQFIERPLTPTGRDRIALVLQEMSLNVKRDFYVSELAEMCAMSERTFMRRFKQKTGMTPLDWLSMARIDRARELLETTTLSIEIIASECGLGTPANLRHHFRRKLAVSPSEYRRRFSQRSARAA